MILESWTNVDDSLIQKNCLEQSKSRKSNYASGLQTWLHLGCYGAFRVGPGLQLESAKKISQMPMKKRDKETFLELQFYLRRIDESPIHSSEIAEGFGDWNKELYTFEFASLLLGEFFSYPPEKRVMIGRCLDFSRWVQDRAKRNQLFRNATAVARELVDWFRLLDSFKFFEAILMKTCGQSKFYRDHSFHQIRTAWLCKMFLYSFFTLSDQGMKGKWGRWLWQDSKFALLERFYPRFVEDPIIERFVLKDQYSSARKSELDDFYDLMFDMNGLWHMIWQAGYDLISAGLFHDIGIPATYLRKLNFVLPSDSLTYDPRFLLNMMGEPVFPVLSDSWTNICALNENLAKLVLWPPWTMGYISSIDIGELANTIEEIVITYRWKDFVLSQISGDSYISSLLYSSLKKENHGAVGSLFMPLTYGARQAIAFHAIEDLEVCFEKHPLAYFLIVADELQEWGRYFQVSPYKYFCPVDFIRLKIDPPQILAEIDYSQKHEQLKRTRFDFQKQLFGKCRNLSRLVSVKINHCFFPFLRILLISPDGHENRIYTCENCGRQICEGPDVTSQLSHDNCV